MPKREVNIITHGEIDIGFLCKEEISALCSAVLTRIIKCKREGTQHKEVHPDC